MKRESFKESIFECLERIEEKVNRISIPQLVGGNSNVDNIANEISLLFEQNDDNPKINLMCGNVEACEAVVRKQVILIQTCMKGQN